MRLPIWQPDSLEVVHGLAQIEEIERFRYSIYVAEQHKPLPAADHEAKRLPDADDHAAFHFCMRNSARKLVGYARMHYAEAIPSSAIAHLELGDLVRHSPKVLGFISKLMVDKSLRGRTNAVRLIMSMIQYGCERFEQAEGAVFHCSSELVPLYTRMGFRPFGSPFMDAYVGQQTPMVAIFRDVDHFSQCGSPIAAIAQTLPAHEGLEAASFHDYFVLKRAFRDHRPAPVPALATLRKAIHASVPGFQNSRSGITLA
ncbi:GNAT family N-acetyltransferase [Caenimonas terrae]|uniref:GNAT family N-acetyltransferase n=1 Tax=Caenimonas terrae TaxID=696074 RepID=A0ABW0N6G0_9BURK